MSQLKKTAIIGATNNPTRYAYFAAERLTLHGHPIIPIGIKTGELAGTEIQDLRKKPPFDQIDTVTLYIGTRHQSEWIDYILGLNPKRIIFNPGTENEAFALKAQKVGIETIEACTLVMLSAKTY